MEVLVSCIKSGRSTELSTALKGYNLSMSDMTRLMCIAASKGDISVFRVLVGYSGDPCPLVATAKIHYALQPVVVISKLFISS